MRVKSLGLALLLYLALATGYSVIVPIGRGADEWAHYWYARFIAENGRLPVNPAERAVAGYKADWPPLYHLLAAGATAWIETDGPPTFKYRADNLRRRLVPAMGPEAILHTEDERFPWQQEILVWHVGRFLSILFSAGTLAATYFIGLELFTDSKIAGGRLPPRTLALAAVAVLAFNPRFLFTGMLFNYDSLTLLLASLFLWLLIRIAKGYYTRWGYWLAGGLAGLALMTKYLAAFLPFLIVLVAVYRARSGDAQGGMRQKVSQLWRPLGQAALAFLLVTVWWFGYLLVNFNEIETYGPVLGTVAPLLRGDGSDRTVEALFAYLSGGQAPAPAYIERQSHSGWQIIAEFPTTFWGNPIVRPYPLAWFVGMMSLVVAVSFAGLFLLWRRNRAARVWVGLLLFHCLLPLPLMLARLFGARDALEAVQGRHILFLAGPAVAVLVVWGWTTAAGGRRPMIGNRWAGIRGRGAVYVLLGLLLAGALGQLIFMAQVYPPLLPVRTTGVRPGSIMPMPAETVLEGGARTLGYRLFPADQALGVSVLWQGGAEPAPEDYRMELALVDGQGQSRSGWLAYQTQAQYPTRTWEPGDTIRDEGWLPLAGLPAGDYEVRWRILGEMGPAADWQRLAGYTLLEPGPPLSKPLEPALWQRGEVVRRAPLLRERETAQVTFAPETAPRFLIGPDGRRQPPASVGPGWANFIVGPDWPAGDYDTAANEPQPLLRVAENGRNFAMPEISYPLAVDFADKIKLLGYDLPSRRVAPGDGLPIILYWQGQQWLGENFVIFNRLLDNNQIAWGGYDRLPQENYSTLLWAPGEIVVDGFAVPVDPDAPDGVYMLSLGWYQEIDGRAESLSLVDPATGEPTGATAVSIGPVKVGGPPPGVTVSEAGPQVRTDALLGDHIRLLGFDIDVRCDSPADSCYHPVSGLDTGVQSLSVTSYWQLLNPVEKDYTVFIHLRDGTGDIVAQKDSPPAGGVYPTNLWDPEEIIKGRIVVPVEKPLESGRYELVIGMYDFSTGVRLPVPLSSDGTVPLKSFEVAGE